VFWLLRDLALRDQFASPERLFAVANLGGIIVSVFTNFLLNDFWTWGDREKRGHHHFFSRLAKFYVVSSVAASVQWGVSVATRSYLSLESIGVLLAALGVVEGDFAFLGAWNTGSVRDILAILLGIAVGTGINYVANNIWTFRVVSE
jgi:putative flippase GtrA